MAADLRIVLMRLASRLRTLRWHAESKTPCTVEFARETLDLYAPLANRLGIWQIKWKWKTLRSVSWSPTATSRSRACWKKSGSSARPSSPARSSACNRRWPPAACTPRSAAGPSISTASGTRCASSVWTSPRCTTCARCASSSTTCATAIRRWAWCTRCGRPSPRNSTTIFRGPSPTATARCTRWWLTTTAGRSRCRSARARCTSSPSTAWPRTGATKPAPRAGRSPRPASTTGSCRGCASCWLEQRGRGRRSGPGGSGRAGTGRPATRGAGKTRQAAAEPTQSDERIYVMTPQARVIELPAGAAGGFRLSPAHRPGASLPRRACRWPDGAAADPVVHGADGRDHLGQVRRSVARLAQPATGLLASPRAQGPHVVQRHRTAAAHHAGAGAGRKGTAAPGQDRRQPEQLAQNLGFARADDLYVAAARNSACGRSTRCSSSPRRPQSRTRGPARRQRRAPRKRQERGAGGGRGFAADAAGALLPPGAAGRHRRLCHPRPRRVHPSSRLSQLRRWPSASRNASSRWPGARPRTRSIRWTSACARDRSGLLRDLSEVFARLRLNVVGVNTQSRQSLAHMVFTVEVRGGESLTRALDALAEVQGVSSAVRR